ncbi:MAG: ACT domain-containing protein [Spirochaetales bacterium]|nr:ACT domain-containing protein [Spirochaetales bacterium]MCF7937124.1 ACT domain-containing protein [Spirochaetales bacterium]
MQAIITVVGTDKVGIIAGVSSLLAETNVNILDISQTILRTYFTMMMLVDLESMTISLKDLKELLDQRGKELGVTIQLQHQDVFQAMHRI